MMTGSLASVARSLRNVSSPVIPPIRTSISMRSGLNFGMTLSASSPLLAVAISISGESKIRRNEYWTSASSSTRSSLSLTVGRLGRAMEFSNCKVFMVSCGFGEVEARFRLAFHYVAPDCVHIYFHTSKAVCGVRGPHRDHFRYRGIDANDRFADGEPLETGERATPRTRGIGQDSERTRLQREATDPSGPN